MKLYTYTILALIIAVGCSPSKSTSPEKSAPAGKAKKKAETKKNEKAKPAKAAVRLSPDEIKSLSSKVDGYQKGVKALITALKSKTEDKSILADAQILTKQGVEITQGMAKAHPICAPYFDALGKAASRLETMDLKTLESDYHDGKALPKSPSSLCYHGKDLVVHPGTVAAIARLGITTDELRQKAIAELNEVVAHGIQVKTSLTAPQP